MRKIFLSGLLLVMSCASLFGITSAAFEEKVSVAGASFTIGESSGTPGGEETGTNTALKIFVNNANSSQGSNLADMVTGPVFENVTPEWVQSVPIKLYNKGTTILEVVGSATYISDPDTLRDDLFIEILAWNDANNNGLAEETEIGESFGHDTILRFKNDTFSLGELSGESVKGYVLRFDGTGLSDVNIGKTAVYDFVFTGVEKASE